MCNYVLRQPTRNAQDLGISRDLPIFALAAFRRLPKCAIPRNIPDAFSSSSRAQLEESVGRRHEVFNVEKKVGHSFILGRPIWLAKKDGGKPTIQAWKTYYYSIRTVLGDKRSSVPNLHALRATHPEIAIATATRVTSAARFEEQRAETMWDLDDACVFLLPTRGAVV